MQPRGRFQASIRPSSASLESFGTSAQWPPTARRTSPSWARRFSPRSLPSPGAAAKTSVSPCGRPEARKRRSMAAISSSGVPMPTKPETATVSPSRRIAAASSGETILFLTARSSPLDPRLLLLRRLRLRLLALGEPLGDPRPEQLLRAAADEDADMAAGQRQLGVVLRPDQAAQRPRGGGRDDVVVLGIDVEHRHGDPAEVDPPAAELELVPGQLVLLVEVLQPLPGGLARVVRAVGDPLLH